MDSATSGSILHESQSIGNPYKQLNGCLFFYALCSWLARYALARFGHLLQKGYQATIESALRPAVKQTFVGILTPWFGVAINETYLITSIVNIVDQAVPQLRSY